MIDSFFNSRKPTLVGAVIVAALLIPVTGASASTFQFFFDNAGLESPGPASAPFVGSGTLSFFGTLGPGSYQLSALPSLSIAFTFVDGDTYSNSDLQTPSDEVLVVLTGTISSEQLTFSNSNSFGTGPFGGSADFVNSAGSFLTFEPPGNEGLLPGDAGLHLYIESNLGSDPAGNYLATQTVSAVPLPSALPLFGTAMLGLGSLTLRRNLRRSKPQTY